MSPLRSPRPTGRAGLTLIEIALCLAIVAALALVVRAFHEPSTEEALRVRAREDMIRFRDRISIHLARHPGESITRLAQILEKNEMGEDPWGNPYVLEAGKQLICTGKNGRLDIEGERRPDDMFEPLPPNPSTPPPPTNEDRSLPVIDPVGPSGVLQEERPEFRAGYRDGGSGIDPASARILVNGNAIATKADETQIRGTPPSELSSGVHLITIEVSDKAGNAARRDWNVVIP